MLKVGIKKLMIYTKTLKKILVLDDYTPFTKFDIHDILVNRVAEYSTDKYWTKISAILDGIHPNNCWKHNYYVEENKDWANKSKNIIIQKYDITTAFIYYVLSNLRNLDREEWNVCMPKITKYPRNKKISIRTYYEHFCKK